MKKWILLTPKILVSGGLIWFALSRVDLAEALEHLRGVDPLFLIAGCGVVLVQAAVGGMRWRAVTVAIKQPLAFMDAVRIFYIGMFFNQALPGGAGGDPVRAYLAYRSGQELRGAVNGVMLERLVTVVALVVLVDATQTTFLSKLDADTRTWFVTSLVLLTIGAIAGLTFVVLLERLPESLRHWRVVRGLSYLGNDTRGVFLNPRNLVKTLGWGLLTHLNISFLVFVLSQGLAMDVTWFDCLILVPPVLLVTTIPISIGGWGVRENAMIFAFALIGVPEASALALSVLFGLLTLAVALPGGLVWFLGREHKAGMTVSAVESELAVGDSANT